TSSITSVMTVNHMSSDIGSVADLQGKIVGVHAGGTSEAYLRSVFVTTLPFDHINEAVEALENDEISAIVADNPVLEYFAHTNPSRPVDVVGNIFHPDKYGFAFSTGHPLVKQASVAII